MNLLNGQDIFFARSLNVWLVSRWLPSQDSQSVAWKKYKNFNRWSHKSSPSDGWKRQVIWVWRSWIRNDSSPIQFFGLLFRGWPLIVSHSILSWLWCALASKCTTPWHKQHEYFCIHGIGRLRKIQTHYFHQWPKNSVRPQDHGIVFTVMSTSLSFLPNRLNAEDASFFYAVFIHRTQRRQSSYFIFWCVCVWYSTVS